MIGTGVMSVRVAVGDGSPAAGTVTVTGTVCRTVFMSVAVVVTACVMYTVAVAAGPAVLVLSAVPDFALQTPNAAWQPAPQWFSVLPHQPCSEQQSPNAEPRHVSPLSLPHRPSLLPCSPLPVAAGPALVVAAAAGVKDGLTQYWLPGVRFAHVVTLGFACRNCETVIPAASDMDAQVSPDRAVTMCEHAAAAAAASSP